MRAAAAFGGDPIRKRAGDAALFIMKSDGTLV